MFKRVVLFIATNLAVVVLLGMVLSVLENVFGVRLGNNATLLVFAAVFGFGGDDFVDGVIHLAKQLAKLLGRDVLAGFGVVGDDVFGGHQLVLAGNFVHGKLQPLS